MYIMAKCQKIAIWIDWQENMKRFCRAVMGTRKHLVFEQGNYLAN